MKRSQLGFLCVGAAAILASAGVLRLSAAEALPGDFRSLNALREVLNSEEMWKRLESLGNRQALWRVSAQVVPAGEGESCLPINKSSTSPEAIQLRFEFGSHQRRSSRSYSVEFRGCRLSGETYNVAFSRAGFTSDFAPPGSPILADGLGLRVLKLALNDAEVFRKVEALQAESRLGYLRIRKEAVDGANAVRYSLVAADTVPEEGSVPETWPAGTRVLRYAVVYDRVTGSAEFHLSEPED